MPRLRSGGNAPTPARTDATRRPVLREKTNITGTPAAVETSMLALKNFKRRPRQGSMLEMVRKRRSSVQQSLVNAQPQDDDVEDTSVFDLGSASEGEDDFAPEAEGTPIQTSKTRKSNSTRKSTSARKSVAPTPAPAVKKSKRKSDDLESPHSALDALRKKHRKSEVSHVEDEPLPSIDDEHQPAERGMSEHEASPVPEPVTSDVQVLNSSPESTPPTEPSSTHKASNIEEANFAVPSTEEQARADATHEDAHEDQEDAEDDLDTPNATMAEPASSSPIGSPIPETQSTDIYADPLTQVSPPPSPEPARTRGKGVQKQPIALSTATLRALLPRRTQRATQRPRRTEYDISSDDEEEGTGFDTTHLDEDEDELGGRMRRQTRNAAPAKGKKAATAAAKSTKAKSNPKQQKPSTTTAATSTRKKPTAPPAPAATGKTKGKASTKGNTTRTYGRASAVTASDKENENEPSSEGEEGEANTSLSMREVAHSKELEEARRKFAEVDDWDLTFESMSNEDHRSSSQGWR
jgi:hypothetical protein